MSNKFHTYSFENLEVWQLARLLRLEIYNLTANWIFDYKEATVSNSKESFNLTKKENSFL